MAITKKEKELAAVGISIAAGCMNRPGFAGGRFV
jgi:alkylhydroperoxidase/carboxymuconolactone decarboxylase family protein YurZ